MSAKVKVLREAQAAKQMDVSAATLARWRRERKIRHWRQFGRLVKYTQEDVDQNIADLKGIKPKLIERSVTEARFG